MLLKLAGHSFRFECENLCRLFFPYSPVRVQDQATPQPPAAPDEPWASVFVEETPAALLLTIQVSQAGEAPVLHRAQELSQLAEYPVTRLLYQLLSELTGVSPAWGMLTGVHPVKLLRQHTERLGQSQRTFAASGWSAHSAQSWLCGYFWPSERPQTPFSPKISAYM